MEQKRTAAMASCRKLQLFLGLVGFMFLIMLSFYDWKVSQESRDAERVAQIQEVRQQLLRERCDSDISFSEGKQSFEDLSNEELKNLLVDDKHGSIYCYIPKVACSNWKRVMISLNKGEPYQDPRSIPFDKIHWPKFLTLLRNFTRTEMKARLKHYTKFLFVRDPFVRLVSAYRNKFQKPREYFYEYYARTILKRYGDRPNPPRTLEEAVASNAHPSFHNFVKYLIDPWTSREPFEPHWRQMNQLCHPCIIKYDFVGHQETLQDDAEQLLRILRLEGHIKFPPSYNNITSPDSMFDWFRSVPLEDRRKLYKVYEADFNLFGYEKPDELLDG